MAFQPAPQCAEIVLNFVCDGQQMANVMNAKYPTTYVQSSLDDLSSAVDGVVGSFYLPWIHSGVTYQNTTVRGLTSMTDLISVDGTSNGPGQAVGDGLPNNVTLCFRLSTGHTGRSARGRFYAMPTIQSQLDTPNTFSTTYADGILDVLSQFDGAITAAGWDLIVLSRFSAGVARPTATHLSVIDIDYRNVEVDSQRGRLPRGH